MMPQIDSLFLRLACRTVLLAVFAGIVIKKDLPLSDVPYVGKYFRKPPA
jgi:hypothetical protein